MSFDRYERVEKMAMNENEIGEVTMLEDGSVIIHSPDGINSECVSANAVNAIAAETQRKRSGSATDLQPKYSGFIPPPNQAGKPLVEDDIFKELAPLFDNKEWVASNSNYKNINELFLKQNNLSKEMMSCLVKKGLFVSVDSAAGQLERRYLPLYRLKQKDKLINNQRIINIFLTVILACALIYTQYNQEKSPVPSVQAEQTATIQTDSVMTYEELHIYITEYCKLKKIQIYPYSEQIILQRINEKGINDIEGIKNEIETRINELSKR